MPFSIATYYSLNDSLATNNVSFNFDYKDGQYGWNESPERGADTFHPFKSGSSGVALYVGNLGQSRNATKTVTAPANGHVFVMIVGVGQSTGTYNRGYIYVNGVQKASYSGGQYNFAKWDGEVNANDTISVTLQVEYQPNANYASIVFA